MSLSTNRVMFAPKWSQPCLKKATRMTTMIRNKCDIPLLDTVAQHCAVYRYSILLNVLFLDAVALYRYSIPLLSAVSSILLVSPITLYPLLHAGALCHYSIPLRYTVNLHRHCVLLLYAVTLCC